MKEYVGHPSQFAGVEEHRLVGGKGDGLSPHFLVAFLAN